MEKESNYNSHMIIITEWCSECCSEAEFEYDNTSMINSAQNCPHCGSYLPPCSVCNNDKCDGCKKGSEFKVI